MVKPDVVKMDNALLKIEALASAAQWLTENNDQISILLEILEVIAVTAKEGQKNA